MRSLIVTGDDYGLALPVNEAIEAAHRDGVLTAASLLVGGRAAADAVARARRNPRLRVGLHVALCEGFSILSRQQIPDLVNAGGEFPSPAAFFVRALVASRSVREQMELEIRAQFEVFRDTGLPFDHVNAHNNMQLHPVVLPILARVAREFGVKAIRVPMEPLGPSFRAARRGLAARATTWAAMAPWAAYVKRTLRTAGFFVNDHEFGVYDCGALDTAWFMRIIAALPEGVSEIHFHPATRRCEELDRTMPRYGHVTELSALTSPDVRVFLAASGVTTVAGFAELCPP